MDFVRILLFQDFGSAVNPATLSGGATPPLTTAEQADRAAVLQRAVQPPPSAATVSTSQNPKPQALEPEAHKLRAAKAHAPGARSAGDQTPDSQTPDVPTVGANSVGSGAPVSRQPSQALQPWAWLGLPVLLCVTATVLLATPVRVFGLRAPEPVFPMVLAFAWAVIRPSILGPFVLLLVGLFLDLLWGDALGLWGLCLLLAYGGALVSRSLMAGRNAPVLAVWYRGFTAIAFIAAYLIVMLRAHVMPDLIATALQFAATLALFPLARRLIDRFEDADVRFR